MKIHLPKFDTAGQTAKANLLPLTEDTSLYALDKTNSVQYELHTRPADVNSPKYRFQLRVLVGTESVRTIVRWQIALVTVIDGLNLSQYAHTKPIVETAMRATPLSLFRSSLEAQQTAARETAAKQAHRTATGDAAAKQAAYTAIMQQALTDHQADAQIQTAVSFVMSQLMPKNVLARVKRVLRRETRKPKDMTIRAYYQNLCRINYEEIIRLPPFGANQQLSQDELLDIILFGTPKSWQREMERQGWDPMTKSLEENIGFMENLEATDDFQDSDDKKTVSSKKSSNKKAKSKSTSGEYHCMLHGKNNTHNSEDCHKLKDSVQKLKGGTGSSNGNKSKNKTWKAKADGNASDSKKDLAAIVNSAVAKAVSNASKGAKRKSPPKDFNVMEALKDFNYDDEMKNLEIDDDDMSTGEVSC